MVTGVSGCYRVFAKTPQGTEVAGDYTSPKVAQEAIDIIRESGQASTVKLAMRPLSQVACKTKIDQGERDRLLSLKFQSIQRSLCEDTLKCAKSYHDHSSLWDWMGALEALKGYSFRGNESVLEAGCINGRIAANIASRVPNGEVIATEVRGPAATQLANQMYSKSLYPNLSFSKAHVLDSDYKNRFDLCYCATTLDDNVDQPATIRKIYQSLKSGGHFICTIRLNFDPEMGANIRNTRTSDKWKKYYANYSHPSKKFTPDEYENLLKEAGFLRVSVQVRPREYRFENKRAFMEFERTHPIGRVIPEDKAEEFLTDIANSYAKQYALSDGQIPLKGEELFIHAVK